MKIVHKVNGTKGRRRWCLNSQKSGHPIFCAEVSSKAIHYCADLKTIQTVFHTIISVNQLSLHGTVAEMCEEYETFHDRSMQPFVGGQSNSSFVPSVLKTEVPLDCGDLARKDLLLQQNGERIEKWSQQDRVSKFCTDAGFLTAAKNGQFFLSKDAEEFAQFTDSVACREYILPRDEDSSEPKGWIKRNTKIGPVLEVATCCLQGKYGVEIRIMSMNKDNSHSWVRISHVSNKFNVIQDAISLILLCRTMYLFRTTSSSTFIMSDVPSIYIPSSIRDWHLEVKNSSKRQTVFFLLVDPMDKSPKDPKVIDLNVPCTIPAWSME